MRNKSLLLGSVVLVALAGLLWWLMRPEPPAQTVVEEAAAEPSRGDRLARKQAQRAEAPDDDPIELVGVVRDTAGGPIAGAVVLLTPKSFESSMGRTGERPQPLHVRTDAGGGFSIADVPSGRYTLSASARGFLPAAHRGVRVNDGRAPASITLTLAAGGHVVSGTIEDVSGGPVEGALFSVQRTDDQNVLQFARAPSAALSDEYGRFALTLPSGSYSAKVSHPDYVARSKGFEVRDGPRTVDVTLTPGAVIEGVVKARGTAEAVGGAIVVAAPPQGSRGGTAFVVRAYGDHRVVADAQGRFRLSGLPPGILRLDAVADGHASAESTEVTLGIAETATDVVVWVEPAFKISGFVVPRNAEGDEGIEGVWVGALSMQPPGLYVARMPSEDDGYFEIPGVAPGNYMVSALSEDHLPNLTGTSAQVDAADVSDVLVELDAGVAIAGRVNPPGPATVTLQVKTEGMGFGGMLSGLSNALVRARTDEDGRFELHPVSAGPLSVIADADDGSHGELELDVGEDGEADVVIELEPRVSLEGTVVNASGDPVADAKVRVKRIDGDASGGGFTFSMNGGGPMGSSTPTGEDGSFAARGLEPGEYEVRVSPARGSSLKFADGESPADGPRRFTVPEGGLQGVRLVVEARDGVITGVVVDADGAPVADAWVRASLEGGGARWMDEMRDVASSRKNERQARMQDEDPKDAKRMFRGAGSEPPVLTDAAGSFTIENLRAGSYRVTAEASGGATRVSEEGVKPGQDVTLQVEALGSVRGQLEQGSKPVPRYTINLRGPTGRSTQINNAKGAFEIGGLDPGTYAIEVSADGGVANAEVEVERGETTDVDLEFESLATVTGTVVDPSGEPLSGLSVTLTGGSMNLGAGLKMLTGMGPTTNASGEFELGEVPPGEGEIMVFDPDNGPVSGATARYSVEPGKTVDLGTITAAAAGDVPVEERGTLGMRTAVRDWAHRPLHPDAPEDPGASPPAEPERDRLWVHAVTLDGPADTAGLEPGDEIIAVGDRDVASMGAHTAAALLSPSHFRAGDAAVLRIERDGSEERITVTAGERGKSNGLPGR